MKYWVLILILFVTALSPTYSNSASIVITRQLSEAGANYYDYTTNTETRWYMSNTDGLNIYDPNNGNNVICEIMANTTTAFMQASTFNGGKEINPYALVEIEFQIMEGASLLNLSGIGFNSGSASGPSITLTHKATSKKLLVFNAAVDAANSNFWYIGHEKDAQFNVDADYKSSFNDALLQINPTETYILSIYADGGVCDLVWAQINMSVVAAPEPITATLLFFGMIGLVIVRRNIRF